MREAARCHTPWRAYLPWTDKRGRFDTLRAVAFALIVAPGLWTAYRWATNDLGARPVNAAIHSTGYWAIWWLIAALVVTTFKALACKPGVVVLRRMVGRAALGYAGIHLVLYMQDQNWRWLAIVSEIVERFYLTIGFVALLGLVVLGVTSSDGWARTLGRNWKRLHRTAYAITALGLIHYLLQVKLDVSMPMLAAGIFTWLMLWRALPSGRDRETAPLLGISLAAAALTVAYEYAWYRFGTAVDPVRVVLGELDVSFGLRPAGQVLMLGLLATAAAELRRIGLGRYGSTLAYTVGIYALGGLVDEAVAFFAGWYMDDIVPAGLSATGLDIIWVSLFALLGYARWTLRGQWQRHLVDAAWLACIAYNLVLLAMGSPSLGSTFAAVMVGLSALLGQRLWLVSRQAALLVLPVAALFAYEAANLM